MGDWRPQGKDSEWIQGGMGGRYLVVWQTASDIQHLCVLTTGNDGSKAQVLTVRREIQTLCANVCTFCCSICFCSSAPVLFCSSSFFRLMASFLWAWVCVCLCWRTPSPLTIGRVTGTDGLVVAEWTLGGGWLVDGTVEGLCCGSGVVFGCRKEKLWNLLGTCICRVLLHVSLTKWPLRLLQPLYAYVSVD